MSITGRYTLSGGVMKYSLPIIPLKEFQFNPGSYVDWRGNIMNPTLSLKATDVCVLLWPTVTGTVRAW